MYMYVCGIWDLKDVMTEKRDVVEVEKLINREREFLVLEYKVSENGHKSNGQQEPNIFS